MSDLRICRICLTTGTKMYRLERFYLRNYYEELTAMKVNIGDNFPHYFCYECAMLLYKFNKFKEKCYSGQRVLSELLRQGPITYESVSKIDRSLSNLQSILQLITESKRIKHYNLIYDEYCDIIKTENQTDELEVEFVGENSYYDDEPIDTTAVDNIAVDTTAIDNIAVDTTAIDTIAIDTTAIDNTACDATAIVATVIDATAIESAENVKVHKTIKKPIKKQARPKLNKRKKVPIDPLEKDGVHNSSLKADTILSADKWKKHKMTLEEAWKEFSAIAQSSKYLKAVYKCTDCYKTFSKEEMLTRHLKLRHDKSFPFECSFCKMRFKRNSPRKMHLRQHFTKYQCLLCTFVCNREGSALHHVEYHSGVKRKCQHCGKLFRHSSTYYTHIRMLHRSEYICDVCGASFVSGLGLHQHKWLRHVSMGIDNSDDKDEKVYCDRCDIKFTTRNAYEEHLLRSALHPEQEAKEKVPPKRVRDPIETAERKRKKKRCDRLRKKPTTCYQCGQHFETQSECMKHHLTEHPGTCFTPPTERIICELCGVSLAPASITTHNNMHRREKEYKCNRCEKTFYNNAALNRHKVIHTGEKPYSCSLCDKRFTQSNSMKLHYRTFHLKEPYPKRSRNKKNK